MTDLKKIAASLQKTAEEAGVAVVTGDTKVVNKGCADKLFINTAGIGVIAEGIDISGSNARAGDKIILSGPIGDHGIAVLSQREGLKFSVPVESDCAPLNNLVACMLASSSDIRSLRDPTRGGLGTTLNEIASQSNVCIDIEEKAIPVREAIRAACELLGLDPLYIANEGKLVAVVAPESVDSILAAMKQNKYGKEAAVIGTVTDRYKGRVIMKTALGASRIIDMLSGEMLPRIC
jgi:hydrogenase expression/formation protein HypE